MANVTLNLTGDSTASTFSDASGNYQFQVAPGGTYTVTPTKSPLAAGSNGITTVDVIATQRHFLNLAVLPPGCRLTAADVNNDSIITTVDVIAIQRFFLGLTTGTANVGKYLFSPTSRVYTGVVSDQVGQNYDALIYGDISTPFVNRPSGLPTDAPNEVLGSRELP